MLCCPLSEQQRAHAAMARSEGSQAPVAVGAANPDVLVQHLAVIGEPGAGGGLQVEADAPPPINPAGGEASGAVPEVGSGHATGGTAAHSPQRSAAEMPATAVAGCGNGARGAAAAAAPVSAPVPSLSGGSAGVGLGVGGCDDVAIEVVDSDDVHDAVKVLQHQFDQACPLPSLSPSGHRHVLRVVSMDRVVCVPCEAALGHSKARGTNAGAVFLRGAAKGDGGKVPNGTFVKALREHCSSTAHVSNVSKWCIGGKGRQASVEQFFKPTGPVASEVVIGTACKGLAPIVIHFASGSSHC
jgi:hypothetical protein